MSSQKKTYLAFNKIFFIKRSEAKKFDKIDKIFERL